MSTGVILRKALILSPVASHPQDYGNRNRVLHTTSYFKDAGYEIHFLLYPFEPDWMQGIPESAKQMRDAWTSFAVVPPSRPLHRPALSEHHQIDEWWDPQIGIYLNWLFAREFFDVFLVNYTFLAKAFEHTPRGTVKILETHDLFSGRREMFAANGAGPDFFYTTPDQEQVAFDRADIVIAIKDGEAQIIREMTSRDVVSLPFFMPPRENHPRPERLSPSDELRVGFLGALNTVNVLNMQRFLERFEKFQRIYVPHLRLDIAGNVCGRLISKAPGVNLLGRVDDTTDFYNAIDVVVAPLMFSTGIKIKVGEALSFGKAVVSTKNGFDGYTATDPFHSLEDLDAVSRALVTLAFDRERLQLLEERTAVAAQLAERHSADGYRSLVRAVKRHSKVIVLVTDQIIWDAMTVQQERVAQWAQLCGQLYKTVVISVAPRPVENGKRTDMRQVKFVDLHPEIQSGLGTIERVMRALDEISESRHVIEVAISVDGELGQTLWHRVQRRYPNLTLDAWVPSLAKIAGERRSHTVADLWLAPEEGAAGAGRFLSTTAFRYEPPNLRGWAGRPRASEILVALCDPGSHDLAGVDLMAKTANGTRPLRVVDCASSSDHGNFSLQVFREVPVPSLMVAVGRDAKAATALQSLAAQAGVECLHASSDRFPLLLGGGELLCRSYADLARQLGDPSFVGTLGSAQAGDAGWSTYWKILAQR
jgi:glycosyltransferase involved in cell wall biosynthesis